MSETFEGLGLIEPLLRALREIDYLEPTPIQRRAIPALLDGRDLLGIAQTGTGKTGAFALPMLQRMHEDGLRRESRMPHALVLAPTRELATQIGDSFARYGRHLGLVHTVVFGGVGQAPQVQALRRGVDILVATPGRLLDLMQQRHVSLSRVEFLVLDEADRMLDMGFVRDVERILDALPEQRQSLLFSATMPDEVARLAQKHLHQPLRIEVTPPAKTADLIDQFVYHVERQDKRQLLVQLLDSPEFERVLVFTRTRHGANRVVQFLRKADIAAHAIHGDKSQTAREQALAAFRSGDAPVLVATDIAARGIDVPGVTHVVNFDIPNVPETYVHRIGRTARAGRSGIAIALCGSEEREFLRDIEKLIRRKVEVAGSVAPSAVPEPAPGRAPQPGRQRTGGARGQRQQQAQPHAPARQAHGKATRKGTPQSHREPSREERPRPPAHPKGPARPAGDAPRRRRRRRSRPRA